MTVCDQCGRAAQARDRFCAECGAPLRRPAPERKVITVLIADLCDSTQQVGAGDLEDGTDYLQQAGRLMGEAVEAFGGTVSQLRGDSVVALFGAPVAHEDHALRACLSALAMHKQLQAASQVSGRPMVLRIGISSGEALVKLVTEFDATYHRADGPVVHLAARLEDAARRGTALLSGATHRLVADQVETRPLGSHEVRGVDETVTMFELTLGAAHSPVAPLARRRELAPMLGRTELLSRFDDVVRSVRDGRMRFIGLRGEAGIGKSRLASAWREQLREGGFADYWVRARAYTSHLPYVVVADLVRALLDVGGDQDLRSQREAARRAVDHWAEPQARHRDAVVDLLDLGDPGDGWRALTPNQRSKRLTEALLWLLGERLARSPVVLVVDDLFFADRDSQRLLEAVARRLERAPLLVCATYRQEFTHRWTETAWFAEFWIGPLAQPDMTALALALVGDDPSAGDVVALLVERADGNPFFLEQLAMTLVDDGTLVGPPGAYRCARPVVDVWRPGEVIQVVISSRVDRLPAGSKSALECAAILGDPITPALVAAMLGQERPDVQTQLGHALSAGLLSLAAGSERFTFRHALVQEVIIGALARTRRKQLHRAAFEALRSDDSERSPDRAAMLVHHAYAGEAWPEAVEFARRAMTRSIARSANRDAERVFELGLDATGRAGSDGAALLPLELALRMEALGAQLPLGHIDLAVDNLWRARAITQQLGDVRREAGVTQQLAVILWTRGSYGEGLEAAATAELAARRANSRSVQMAARQARMMLHHGQGRYAAAAEGARQVLRDFAVELGGRQLMTGWAVIASVNVHAFLADTLGQMGEFDDAQAACDAGYRELGVGEHAFSRVMMDFVQGSLWLAVGRHADAAAVLDQALKLCGTHDVPTMRPPIVARWCAAVAALGQAELAVTTLERAMADNLPQQGGRYNEWYFPFSLADALSRLGRHGEALASAQVACDAARRYGQRGHEAEALALLAQIHGRCGHAADAVTAQALAQGVARDCAMHALEAACAKPGSRLAADEGFDLGRHG
jgi:class 3 adenylate cyclase/tetratricopeptide (TPR) repeat protein